MTRTGTPSKGHAIGQLLTGAILGAALTAGGFALAGKLRPPDEPEALIALAQTADVTDKQADVLLARGDVAGAIAVLEQMRTTKWPGRARGGDACVQIRHDLYGRLLRLRLDNPQVDPKSAQELLALVEEGLGSEWELLDPNPFTAHLLALRGEILEQLGRDGDALLVYQRALDMNRDLLDEVMEGSR